MQTRLHKVPRGDGHDCHEQTREECGQAACEAEQDRQRAGREADCSFRPWLSLPLAGVDPENAGCGAQTFHVKERMFTG